jgi:hypothetical protein
MASKFTKLKEQLSNLEHGESLNTTSIVRNRKSLLHSGLSSPSWLKYTLFAGFMSVFVLYAGIRYAGTPEGVSSPVEGLVTWMNQPDEELLSGMQRWMEEMGYTGLTREDLIELRRQGVTATNTSRMRDLGYTNLTLDDLVLLGQNDVSATFAAMMKELGYTLTIDDLIELRQHGVTAYFTSNMHDLGYTDITKDELIRLRDTGVQASDVEQLISQSEELPSIEEIIRYRISNQ